MDEPVEREVENGEKTAEEKALEERMGKLEEAQKDSSAFANVMADPQVRELLEARHRGEEVEIVLAGAGVGGGKKDEEEVVDESNLEDMSNAQLLETMSKKVGKVIGEALDEKMKPLDERVGRFEKKAENDEVLRIQRDVGAAKKKYPDLESYQDEIITAHKENPALSVEELYMLARMRKGDGPPPKPTDTESERPTHTSARTPERETRKVPLPPGKRGFAQILVESKAVEEMDIPEPLQQ